MIIFSITRREKNLARRDLSTSFFGANPFNRSRSFRFAQLGRKRLPERTGHARRRVV